MFCCKQAYCSDCTLLHQYTVPYYYTAPSSSSQGMFNHELRREHYTCGGHMEPVPRAKICSKSVRQTQPELHTSLLLQYTIARAAIVNQLNMNEDAPGWMFER